MKVDKQETDPKLEKEFEEVEKILEEKFKDSPKGMGFCHVYWHAKKELLKDMYNIDWQSPAELNPHIIFD